MTDIRFTFCLLLLTFGATFHSVVKGQSCQSNADCADGCCKALHFAVSRIRTLVNGSVVPEMIRMCNRYSSIGSICRPYSVSVCGCRPDLECQLTTNPYLRKHNLSFCHRKN